MLVRLSEGGNNLRRTPASAAGLHDVYDIDPLATLPPSDIVSWTENQAKGAVVRPKNLSASLEKAIHSGAAQACISDLMRRINGFEQRNAAKEILAKIASVSTLSQSQRDTLFTDIVSLEKKRALRLIHKFAEDCKRKARVYIEYESADFFDLSTPNGLTEKATRSLDIACHALANQMSADFNADILNIDRIETIIGGEIGMRAVGTALMKAFYDEVRSRRIPSLQWCSTACLNDAKRTSPDIAPSSAQSERRRLSR